eukprot:tig00000842_g4827.t1
MQELAAGVKTAWAATVAGASAAWTATKNWYNSESGQAAVQKVKTGCFAVKERVVSASEAAGRELDSSAVLQHKSRELAVLVRTIPLELTRRAPVMAKIEEARALLFETDKWLGSDTERTILLPVTSFFRKLVLNGDQAERFATLITRIDRCMLDIRGMLGSS